MFYSILNNEKIFKITYSANYPSDDQVFDYFDVYTAGKLSKNTVTCVAKNESE